MEFNDFLTTEEGHTLFCGPDSKNYRLYKFIWDKSRELLPKQKTKKTKKGK